MIRSVDPLTGLGVILFSSGNWAERAWDDSLQTLLVVYSHQPQYAELSQYIDLLIQAAQGPQGQGPVIQWSQQGAQAAREFISRAARLLDVDELHTALGGAMIRFDHLRDGVAGVYDGVMVAQPPTTGAQLVAVAQVNVTSAQLLLDSLIAGLETLQVQVDAGAPFAELEAHALADRVLSLQVYQEFTDPFASPQEVVQMLQARIPLAPPLIPVPVGHAAVPGRGGAGRGAPGRRGRGRGRGGRAGR